MGNERGLDEFLLFNLVVFLLFGLAALIMIPVSLKRGENGMAVFWSVQFLAMSYCFGKTIRKLPASRAVLAKK